MVSKPDYYLNLNLCDSQTQSLASCELLVWNFFKCFLTLKGFRSSFDIVQFSRSCAPHPLGWAAHLLYLIRCRLSSTFLRFFRSRFPAPCPLEGCPIILPLRHLNVNTFFHVFPLFLRRAVQLRFLLRWPGLPGRFYTYIYGKKQPRRLPPYRCSSTGFFKPARISL